MHPSATGWQCISLSVECATLEQPTTGDTRFNKMQHIMSCVGYTGNSIHFSVRKTGIQILGLQITSPVTLGRLLDLFHT